jgi:subtilase family serine protease
VIAVGGTTLYTDSSGNYGGEVVWSSTGGSPSILEPQPAWQAGVVPGSFRGVPDIAFDADPNSGAIIVVNGAAAQYGGTSLAAPIFVGAYARIQAANNARLGFPATWLYKYGANHASAFNDVTSGSNGAYGAVPGWDYTTGFGSFDVSAAAAFTRPTINVAVSPGTVVPGGRVTLTATVAGNDPTGTVQFWANGAALGAPVALVSGVAILTTTLTGTPGIVAITASYAGDLYNAGGTNTTPLSIVINTATVPALPVWAAIILAFIILRVAARATATRTLEYACSAVVPRVRALARGL